MEGKHNDPPTLANSARAGGPRSSRIYSRKDGAARPSSPQLKAAPDRISLHSQLVHQLEEG